MYISPFAELVPCAFHISKRFGKCFFLEVPGARAFPAPAQPSLLQGRKLRRPE